MCFSGVYFNWRSSRRVHAWRSVAWQGKVTVRLNRDAGSIGLRARGGGGVQFLQLQNFVKMFGQTADDSGKSTREKTL